MPHFEGGGFWGRSFKKFQETKIAFVAQQIYIKIGVSILCGLGEECTKFRKQKKKKKLDAAESVGRDEKVSYE